MMRFVWRSCLVLALWTSETAAQTSQEEQTTHLHLTAPLLGYQLSTSGSPVSTVSGVLELGPISFAGYATVPLFGVIGGDVKPYRLEGQLRLTFRDSLAFDVMSAEDKLTYIERKRHAIEVSMMYAHGAEKVTNASTELTTTSDALIAVVGYGVVDSAGYRSNRENYSKRRDYRWSSGGIDALIDVKREYDQAPDSRGTRFGGRLWVEALVGPTAARLEFGRYPAYSGWLLVLSGGLALHI